MTTVLCLCLQHSSFSASRQRYQFMMYIFCVLPLLLSKTSAFFQDEYRVFNDRCDLVDYNRTYTNNVTFALSLVNRTTRAFNFRAHLLLDLGVDVRLTAQFYKFQSNEYRLFPMTVPLNLCKDLLDKGMFGLDDVKKFSNVKLCPFNKGWYVIRNFIPDYRKFAPHIPFGQYKAEMKYFHSADFVLQLDWYGRIEEIIKWNK